MHPNLSKTVETETNVRFVWYSGFKNYRRILTSCRVDIYQNPHIGENGPGGQILVNEVRVLKNVYHF